MENNNENAEKKEPITLEVQSASHVSVSDDIVDLWLAASWAQNWFNDALREAQSGTDSNFRRREIIFAVAFAESYLVEWVRDDVLKGDKVKFKQYFPPKKKMPAKYKWKEFTKQLKEDGLIKDIPNFRGVFWQDFTTLVDYRDGLIHAAASRPESSFMSNLERPVPSPSKLNKLEAGWAIKVAVELVRNFHKAAESPTPEWLKVI